MKRVFLLGIVGLAFIQSCNNDLENPHYPDVPSIKFVDVKFIEVGDVSDYDTLKLTISYRDGDSDLGLSSLDINDYLFPYHSEDLFLENGVGDTLRVRTAIVGDRLVINSIPQAGTLVTHATREKPNYGYLPEYDPTSCVNYIFFYSLFVREDLGIIDGSFNIIDTVMINGQDYIEIRESLLYKINDNHYNMFVEFYVFNGGDFQRYDWFEEFCLTYDGRFPVIGDKPGGTFKSGPFKVNIKTPWEGKIIYNMPNTSFPAILGENTMLKLAITIKDRALHTSNTVITPEFTLEGIK